MCAETAFIVTSMLRTAVDEGTAKVLSETNLPIAAKREPTWIPAAMFVMHGLRHILVIIPLLYGLAQIQRNSEHFPKVPRAETVQVLLRKSSLITSTAAKRRKSFPCRTEYVYLHWTKPHLKPNIKQSLQQRIPPTVRSFGNTFRFLLHLPKQASSGNCRLLRRMYHGEVMSAEIPQYDSPHRIHGFAIESFVPNAEFSEH